MTTTTTTTTSPTEILKPKKTKRERLDASGRRAKPPRYKRRRMLRTKDPKTGRITWAPLPKVREIPPRIYEGLSGRLPTTSNIANPSSFGDRVPYTLRTRMLAAARAKSDS